MFVAWAQRVRNTKSFNEWEIGYKHEIADNLQKARTAVKASDGDWLLALKRAFGPPNNLTAWQAHASFLQWCEGHSDEASKALLELWGDGPEESRMRGFMKALPAAAAKGAGARAALVSFLMMALDVATHPMYRVKAFEVAARLSGRGKLPRGADEVQQYLIALNFLDDLIAASAAWDEPIANRLEAQGIVWAIAKWGKTDDWSNEEWTRLERYRKGEKVGPGEGGNVGESGSEKPKSPKEKRRATDGAPLNIVLYGPPGTGKTYQAVERAVEICDGKQRTDRSEIMQRYKQLTSDGRISFVTFHQSYGYEEFVEGYRPASGSQGEEDAEAAKGIQYEVQDGAFKTIALSARDVGRAKGGAGATYDPKGSRRVWKMSLGRANDPRDARIYDECMQKNMLLLGYGEGLDFTGCDTREAVLKRLRRESPDMKPTDFNVTSVNAFKNEMSEGDFVVVSDGNRKFRAIGRVTSPYKFFRADEYGQMRSVEWLLVLDESMPREKISKKLFSQMTIYELSPNDLNAQAFNELLSRKAGHEAPNHVLIIDEINRGNISKILGELITLLEPDKRLGMLNELKVRLPYSGDDFGVPSNLYVIGTMNTADRSIAFLDTALRRRFEFEEIMPKPEVIREEQHGGKIGNVDLPQLLGTINARIERLFDRDHMIGHSYLMDCKSLQDLRRAFEKKIIPLLQEYFYGDWDRVCVVLACPWDGDQAEPKCPNASPIITARRMVSLPWASSNGDDFEERLSYNVNPAFLNASDTALLQFFSGVASVSNGN
jgi:5-methylcytosine-specific restriction protein B